MYAEKSRPVRTSASIASLRFSLGDDLVAASPRCALALNRNRFFIVAELGRETGRAPTRR